MKKLTVVIFICHLVLCPGSSPASPPGNPAMWTMTFNDEFDGTSLDRAKWSTTFIGGRRTNAGNAELEWYIDDAAIVAGGSLKLVATNLSSQSGYPYSSGLISGHAAFSQMYGYFEARMKIPRGRGLWPAFWMLPLPDAWPPEIDIMENLGQATGTIYMSYHYNCSYPNLGGSVDKCGQYDASYSGPDFAEDFHVYGLEWNETALIWYIDGVESYRNTKKVPIAVSGFTGMYLIANLAVGGNWPGPPDKGTIFPAQLEIDYIRVYAKVSSTQAAAATLTPGGDLYTEAQLVKIPGAAPDAQIYRKEELF